MNLFGIEIDATTLGLVAVAVVWLFREYQLKVNNRESTPALDALLALLLGQQAKQQKKEAVGLVVAASAEDPDLRELLATLGMNQASTDTGKTTSSP